MSLLAAASAAIEFIGLIMITTQTTPMRALLPQVPLTAATQSIPHHVALIAFPARAIDSGNWPHTALGISKDYEKILLNRERVVFDTLTEQNLPTASSLTAAAPLALPKLSGASSADLRAEFKPPFQGAQGVIELPFGALSACQGLANRIDGLLTLNTNGKLKIRTVDGTKYIVLNTQNLGDDKILVANVPNPYENAGNVTGPLVNHWQVYYAMTTMTTGGVEPRRPADAEVRGTCFEPPMTVGEPKGGNGARNQRVQSTALMPREVARVGAPPSSSAPATQKPARQATTTVGVMTHQAAREPVSDYVNTAECGSTQWP